MIINLHDVTRECGWDHWCDRRTKEEEEETERKAKEEEERGERAVGEKKKKSKNGSV
jgi:hypothetical protein